MDIQIRDVKPFEQYCIDEFSMCHDDGDFERDVQGFYESVETERLWRVWELQAAKASVAEGFVLVSAEQLSKWGHMANYAEQYGCPECFESRGYAHTLSCEINEYFAIEAQEQAK